MCRPTLEPQPFVHLNVDSTGERGLLGVAFDPDFLHNGFVYVYHTVPASGGAAPFNEVSRFTAAGDVAAAGSEVDLFALDPLGPANHNGGAIHFGPDGKLYVGVGENGTPANSQSLGNLLGKILRINPDGSIPADNPFFNVTAGPERAIWALGLRNPFTFAFQPGTGQLFINDVGESTWEEIDRGAAGANYGWPGTEGPFDPTDPRFAGFTNPVFSYGHGAGDQLGVAVVGGAFYNPAVREFPAEFAGTYFFADLGNGWIRTLDPASGKAAVFAEGGLTPVDLKVSVTGALFYLARGGGGNTGFLARVDYTPGLATPNQRFVASLYEELLERQPDAVGLAAATALLDRGLPRAALVQALENTPERRSVVAQDLYRAVFRRQADAVGLQAAVNFLSAGGTAEQLESILLGSDENFILHGQDAGRLIRGLFLDVLARPADAAGFQAAAAVLAAGASRQQLTLVLLGTPESHVAEARTLYRQFLRRDADPLGLAAAAKLLQSGLTDGQLAAVLLSTDEYFADTL
jgi:glucose/arabinose dehydrogenase